MTNTNKAVMRITTVCKKLDSRKPMITSAISVNPSSDRVAEFYRAGTGAHPYPDEVLIGYGHPT
jgi:hypothetical protein